MSCGTRVFSLRQSSDTKQGAFFVLGSVLVTLIEKDEEDVIVWHD